MKEFNYSVADRRENVVVLGGGPSTARCMNKIIEYIKEHNSLVISANYEFPHIQSHFVYFTDRRLFVKQIPKLRTRKIIINILVKDLVPRLPKLVKKRHVFYYIGRRAPKKVVYHCNKICRDEFGTYSHSSMGTAGFGAIAVATLSRPKDLLITGFDGPNPDYKSKNTWDGRVLQYKRSIKSTQRRRKYFINILLPWVVEQNINLHFFEGDKLWGANRSLGIEHES